MFDLKKVHADALAISELWRTRFKLKIMLQIFGLTALLAMSSNTTNDLNGLRFAARLMVANTKSEQSLKPVTCSPWRTVNIDRHQTTPCIPPRAFL